MGIPTPTGIVRTSRNSNCLLLASGHYFFLIRVEAVVFAGIIEINTILAIPLSILYVKLCSKKGFIIFWDRIKLHQAC